MADKTFWDSKEAAQKAKKVVKQCPKCEKWMHARAGTCGNCNHAFVAKPAKADRPAKAKPGRKPGRPVASSGESLAGLVTQAEKFIASAGGADKAKEVLGMVEKFQGS